MSALPAAVPAGNASQGAQASQGAIHANNVARWRAALQRRQAKLAATRITTAQQMGPVNSQSAATPATLVTIRTTFRDSGDRGRHVPFDKISLAAQAKRVALIKAITENWKIPNQTWPKEIRPVRRKSENGVKRVVPLLPRDMSTNMLEGLCKLSSMTRGQAPEAHRLLLAIVRARSALTGVPFNLQIKDIVSAIEKVQEYAVAKRATAARQQGQQAERDAPVPALVISQPTGQPAGARTTMSLTASTEESWAEHAVPLRNLFLMMQRRAVAAQKQNVTFTLTL